MIQVQVLNLNWKHIQTQILLEQLHLLPSLPCISPQGRDFSVHKHFCESTIC